MNVKIKPRTPIKVKLNWWNFIKLGFMLMLSTILWFVLLFACINILTYYISSLINDGFLDSETLKYAVMLVIGSYFCLILDKNKIFESLNIRKDLPFITIEQTEEKKYELQSNE